MLPSRIQNASCEQTGLSKTRHPSFCISLCFQLSSLVLVACAPGTSGVSASLEGARASQAQHIHEAAAQDSDVVPLRQRVCKDTPCLSVPALKAAQGLQPGIGAQRKMLRRDTRHADGSLRSVVGLALPLTQVASSTLSPQEVLERVQTLELGAHLASDTRLELRLVRDARDLSGHRHLRFQSYYGGLKLEGGLLDLHLQGGTLTGLTSALPVPRVFEGIPDRQEVAVDWSRLRGRLLEQEGLELARLTVDETVHAARLGLYLRPDGRAVPGVWGHAVVRRGPQAGETLRVVVDASSGQLWEKTSLVETLASVPLCTGTAQLNCTVMASGYGEDGQLYSVPVFRGSAFPPPVLYDEYVHPMVPPRYPDLIQGGAVDDSYFVDLSQASTRGAIYVVESDGSIANPADLVQYDAYDHIPSGPGASFPDQEPYGRGINALVGIGAALAYFAEEHGRPGISGLPGQPVDIVARAGLSGLNAAWVSDYNYMLFGSFGGDTLAVAVDVAGHELTHGVLRHSANLGNAHQTGALNEGLADMFGVLIEASANQTMNGALDWFIAEDITSFPPLRNLKHPEKFGMPEHMSQYVVTTSDSGGVHTNMSIPCKAFALAVDGTGRKESFYGYQVPPADRSQSLSAQLVGKVLYQTVVDRLVPTSQFEDWALGMLAATDDAGLSASQADAVYQSLLAAFYATGILVDPAASAVSYLTGQVLSATARVPVEGVTVTVSAAGGVLQSVVSSEKGTYTVALPTASLSQVSVALEKPGYYSATQLLYLPVSSVQAQDTLEQELLITPRPDPVLQARLTAPSLEVPAGGSAQIKVQVYNLGHADSQLNLQGRPVVHYNARAGAAFDWLDVRGMGSPVSLTGDQEHSTPIPLPVSFPFYGKSYDSLHISTDGYVTLVPDPTDLYHEFPIPDPRSPRALIAPYWADLDFDSSTKAYFTYVGGSAWVQFDDVWDYFDQQHYTFQLQLLPDGVVRFQYSQLSGPSISWARVGIQDEQGTEGLELALITQQDTSEMPRPGDAIELVPSFWPAAEGAVLEPGSTVLMGGKGAELALTLHAGPLAPGSYALELRLDHNDPTQGTVRLPLQITVR